MKRGSSGMSVSEGRSFLRTEKTNTRQQPSTTLVTSSPPERETVRALSDVDPNALNHFVLINELPPVWVALVLILLTSSMLANDWGNGVFQTHLRFSRALGNKSQSIQVSESLPNKRDLDTWYEEDICLSRRHLLISRGRRRERC